MLALIEAGQECSDELSYRFIVTMPVSRNKVLVEQDQLPVECQGKSVRPKQSAEFKAIGHELGVIEMV